MAFEFAASQDQRESAVPAMKSVTVVCPMFNEEALIEANVTRLVESLDRLGRGWELVLVNDGSTDRTLQIVQALAERESRIVLVTYCRNRGRGYALRRGFTQASGDVVAVTESDLSYGEDIIRQMIEKLEAENLDAVVASPHCEGGGLENVPTRRAFYTKAGNRILQFLMPLALTTYTGMTRAYRREVIQSLDLESDGKEIHLEIISKLGSLGYDVGEIPATLAWPEARKARKGKLVPWRYVVSHLLFGVGEAPLLLLGVLGLCAIALGTMTGIYLLVLSVSGTPVATRPLLLFSALLILVGFFVLVLGFLAQQNKRLERLIHRLQAQIRKGMAGIEHES